MFSRITGCVTRGLAALLLFAGAASAATISGYVREAGTQESMPYVSVYIDGLRMGSMSNENGYYVITGVPPGQYNLVAALIGYKTFNEPVEVNGQAVVRNVVLEEEAIELDAVSVEAERVKSPSLEIVPSRETFRGMELKLAPAAVEADPIRTLQTLPGVVQLSDFNTGLYVRGGTPDQNLILVDGAELYNVSHFFGLFSTFPADAIKTTELLMGGFPAQYGGRLSSVLNVTTDEGNKEEIHGVGGISMLSSRLTLEGPVPNGSILVSGRRTYLEPVLKLAGLDELGYYFYDFQGKLHQVYSHEDQMTIAGYLGKDSFTVNDPETGIDVKMEWGNWSTSGTWTHLFSSQLYSHYQINASQFKSRSQFEIEDFGFADENTLSAVDFKSDFTYFFSDRHTFEAGAHLKRHNMKLVQEFANQRYEGFDIIAWVPSVYVQDAWKPYPFLTIQPGLRGSLFHAYNENDEGTPDEGDSADYFTLDPRLTVRYQIGDDTFLKASVGRYSQYLFRVPREIQGVSFLSDIWFTADGSSGLQYATHYIGGFETSFGEDVELSSEIYYKDYDDIAEFNFKADAPQTTGEALLRGDGYAYGWDTNIRKRAGRHMGWISYSLNWTVRNIDGLNPADPNDPNSPSEDYYPKYDQRQLLNAIYSYQFSRHWTLNASYAFASGQSYSQTFGHYAIEDPILRLDPEYKDRLNSNRITAYSRLDLGIRGNFHGWGIKWMPFLQIVNVLNRENEFNRFSSGGDWDATNPEYAKVQKFNQLPFLPTIGLDLEF